jgi:Flp pilus assembly protein TadG
MYSVKVERSERLEGKPRGNAAAMPTLPKQPAVRSRRPVLAFVRRFVRHKKGTTAIEFSIVVLPFIALLFAIIETAIVFFASQTLEAAVADSARLILTGQAQTGGLNQTTFKNAVCARVYGMFDCANKMYIDVRKFSTFANVTMTSPVDANGNVINNFTYDPGGPGDIVVVRLMYPFPIYLQLMGLKLADMAGNKRMLIATAAFRNEPY